MARSWLATFVCLALLSFSQMTAAGVMDNVNDGLRLAGQMFGINTAADVANLVAKAFSKATTANTRKKPDLMSMLQHGFLTPNDEEQEQQAQEEQEQEQENQYDQTEQQSEPENAQESPPLNKRRPLTFNSVEMLTNMMRMIGFDPRKLGALAINAIVMVAQAIGSTILQATRGDAYPGPEAVFEPSEHQPRDLKPGSPIDWFLQRPGNHTQRMIRRIMDRKLPDHIVDIIESRESPGGNEAACLKLLMCKGSPIIWGMQDSLKNRLAGESEEPDESVFMNANGFFKYLPSLSEFRKHSDDCELRYAEHCPRENLTMGKH